MSVKIVNLKDRSGNELKIHGSDVVRNANGDPYCEEGAEINDTYYIHQVGSESVETGFSAQYKLMKYVNGDETQDPVQVGATISIPADMVVSAGEVDTVTAEDKASGGKFENDDNFDIGDKYIDLTIANAESSHIYINVKDLGGGAAGTVYIAGNGITITDGTGSDEGKKIISLSIKDTTNLDFDSSTHGLKLKADLATDLLSMVVFEEITLS